MEEKEPFLSRWSRRKLETKVDQPASAVTAAESRNVAAAVPVAPAAEPSQPGLPKPDTPEYREFFDPEVDEKLRRTALKKLFSEPQFNLMDGLDTYIDDYSIADPIPEAMLRQLNQAKGLFLFDDEKKPEARASAAEGPAAATPADLGVPANPAAAGVPGAAAAPPPPDSSTND